MVITPVPLAREITTNIDIPRVSADKTFIKKNGEENGKTH